MSNLLPEPEAEARGFNAYVDGDPQYANPYASGTTLYFAWQDGWNRAYLANWRERELDERDLQLLRRRT